MGRKGRGRRIPDTRVIVDYLIGVFRKKDISPRQIDVPGSMECHR